MKTSSMDPPTSATARNCPPLPGAWISSPFSNAVTLLKFMDRFHGFSSILPPFLPPLTHPLTNTHTNTWYTHTHTHAHRQTHLQDDDAALDVLARSHRPSVFTWGTFDGIQEKETPFPAYPSSWTGEEVQVILCVAILSELMEDSQESVWLCLSGVEILL